MPIEAVKIPQNVYVEDRIVGPLTLRQVIIVSLGTGGSYAIWSSLLKAFGSIDIVTTVLVWTPAALSVAFAFVRVNDLSLMRILLLMVERMNKPNIRTFGPRTGISISVRTFTTAAEQGGKRVMQASGGSKADRLAELSTVLDQKQETVAQTQTTDNSDLSPALEPLDDVPVRSPVTASIPVNPQRIQVSANDTAQPIDGVRARSSIYSTSLPTAASNG